MPFCASFYATCLISCDKGESLGTATCHRTVVEGKQGHAPCKILFSHKASFLCQSNLMGIM